MVGSIYPKKTRQHNRDNIIVAVISRVQLATYKYGIDVPRSIEHAKQLDKKNDNTFWVQALAK